DRWHIGEMVYGPKYRGTSIITPAHQWIIEQRINRMGGTMVVMLPDEITTRERLMSRGDDMIAPDDLVDIFMGYRNASSYIQNMCVTSGPPSLDEQVAHPWNMLHTAHAIRSCSTMSWVDRVPTFIGGEYTS